MTAPTSHGYPDWNRQAAVADTIYLEQPLAGIGDGTTFGPFYVGGAKYIGVLTAPHSARTLWTWFFSEDPGGVIAAGSHAYNVPDGASWQYAFPVRGPFLTITVNMVGGPLMSGDLRLWQSSKPGPAFLGVGDRQIFSANGQSVIAGATSDLVYGSTARGRATIKFSTSALTYLMNIYSLDVTGARTNLWGAFNDGIAPQIGELHFECGEIHASFHNTDAVTRVWSLFVSIDDEYN